MKDEEGPTRDQRKSQPVIPPQRLLQIQHRKSGKHDQGDDFLHRLELRGAIDRAAPTIGGHRQQYSKKAIPQLVRITAGSQLSLYLRWPYQANVMKILDPNSINTGRIDGGTVGMDILSGFQGLDRSRMKSDRP